MTETNRLKALKRRVIIKRHPRIRGLKWISEIVPPGGKPTTIAVQLPGW